MLSRSAQMRGTSVRCSWRVTAKTCAVVGGDRTGEHVATQDLGHFQVDQVGRVGRLARREQPGFQRARRRRTQQDLDRRRGA